MQACNTLAANSESLNSSKVVIARFQGPGIPTWKLRQDIGLFYEVCDITKSMHMKCEIHALDPQILPLFKHYFAC